MEQPTSAGGARRIIRSIVVTYTLEGDREQTEHTFGLSHSGQGEVVDGLVWSRDLMDRLKYEDAQQPGRCVPVTRKDPGPQQQWQRIGSAGPRPGRGAGGNAGARGDNGNGGTETLRTSSDGDECLWLHEVSCAWISFCPPDS